MAAITIVARVGVRDAVRRGSATYMSINPIATSSAAPAVRRSFRPSTGRSTNPASITPTIGACTNREGAEREAEYERGEHELEGVRSASEHERQHADPRDLVSEGGDGGAERSTEQQPSRPTRR